MLAKFFFFACLWTSTSCSVKMGSIFTEQAWSIKGLLHGIKHQNLMSFPCGTKPVSEQDVLPARVANHSAHSVHLAAHGASHIIFIF